MRRNPRKTFWNFSAAALLLAAACAGAQAQSPNREASMVR